MSTPLVPIESRPAPWHMQVLSKHRQGTFHLLLMHRQALADEPLRRAVLGQARGYVERAWIEHYEGVEHGRVFWHFDVAHEMDERNAIRVTLLLLAAGERPRLVT